MNEFPTRPVDCLCYLVTLAILVFISLTVDLRGPRCYIEEFYVPALDLSQKNPTSNNNSIIINPCLFFDLAFHNVLTYRSVYYEDRVNVTFSYGRSAVASYAVPTFFQGKGKTAHRREVVESRGVPWETAVEEVLNGSTAVFRVDLAARPRFMFWFWYSKKKNVRIGADVEVDGSGMKVKKEYIRLDSGASPVGVGNFLTFTSLLVSSQCLFY
ncbi:hypothetical protein ABFS82_13G025900 [Erythranthe guttata]|uniref:protein NDR1-like n=1 Tax=Erythranthe guttata TaxID=4155 RepID=UPI00064D7489|nr:PREDICTED: protein NDR1-like [Erythranthe guttata]|eukprot:XP_012852386.1 PREDICTED: protein NDR1-like [Erythranthe guttata]